MNLFPVAEPFLFSCLLLQIVTFNLFFFGKYYALKISYFVSYSSWRERLQLEKKKMELAKTNMKTNGDMQCSANSL